MPAHSHANRRNKRGAIEILPQIPGGVRPRRNPCPRTEEAHKQLTADAGSHMHGIELGASPTVEPGNVLDDINRTEGPEDQRRFPRFVLGTGCGCLQRTSATGADHCLSQLPRLKSLPATAAPESCRGASAFPALSLGFGDSTRPPRNRRRLENGLAVREKVLGRQCPRRGLLIRSLCQSRGAAMQIEEEEGRCRQRQTHQRKPHVQHSENQLDRHGCHPPSLNGIYARLREIVSAET